MSNIISCKKFRRNINDFTFPSTEQHYEVISTRIGIVHVQEFSLHVFYAIKNCIKYEQKYFNLPLYNILIYVINVINVVNVINIINVINVVNVINVINVPSQHPCDRPLCSLVNCSYVCKYMNIAASHRDAALFINLSGALRRV